MKETSAGANGPGILVAVLASLTLLLASPSWAEPIPASARGAWSTGDCHLDGSTFLTNSAAIMWFSASDLNTEAYIGPAKWVAGSLVLPDLMPEYGGAVLLLTEGIERCEALPNRLQSLFLEAFAVFEGLDRAVAHCGESSMRRCASAVFDLIDISGDNRFSRAEISRMIRVGTLFAGYEAIAEYHDDPFVPVEDLSVIRSLRSDLLGLAADMIDSYDFDGDGFLSPEELLQDRSLESLEAAAGDLASGVPSTLLTAIAEPMASLMGSVLSSTIGSTLSPPLTSTLSSLSGASLSIVVDAIVDSLR